MPDTIPKLLGRIQTLAKAKTIECDHLGIPCYGTGRIPNPAYAGLLALVQEKCLRCSMCEPDDAKISGWGPRSNCDGSGFALRTAYWEAAADGELEGALYKAIGQAWKDKAVGCPSLIQLYETLRGLLSDYGDTRIEVLTAVAEWLEAKP